MKRFTEPLKDIKQRRFIQSTVEVINNITIPSTNKQEIIGNICKTILKPSIGELSTYQSHAKAMFGESVLRKEMYDALHRELVRQTGKGLIGSIIENNPTQRSDVRYLFELIIAYRMTQTSSRIVSIEMNSEKNISPKMSMPDIKLNLDSDVSWILDIKGGNNMSRLGSNILGEISLNNDNTVYFITNNKTPSFESIIDHRLEHLKKDNISPELYQRCAKIATLMEPPSVKNLIMQEQFYNFLLTKPEKPFKMGLYYGRNIDENLSLFNKKVEDKVIPYLNKNPLVFNTQETYNNYISYIVKHCSNDLGSMIFQQTLNSWKEAGFTIILKDVTSNY